MRLKEFASEMNLRWQLEDCAGVMFEIMVSQKGDKTGWRAGLGTRRIQPKRRYVGMQVQAVPET